MSSIFFEQIVQLRLLVGDADEVLGAHIDDLLISEHLHEHLDAFFGGHVVADNGAETAEGTIGDFDLVTRLHAGFEGLDFVFADFLAEEGDQIGIDSRALVTKVDHSGNASGVDHRSILLLQIESGKEVGRKHRLVEQDFAPFRRFVITDAWAESFDTLKLAQGGCCDVLRLVLGTESVPGGAVFEMVGRQFIHKAVGGGSVERRRGSLASLIIS